MNRRYKQGWRGGIHFCMKRYTLFQEIKDIIRAFIENEEREKRATW